MTAWAPELVDLVRPRDRKRAEDGILTDDLIWAGLALAGVAAGRALHEAMVHRVIDAESCSRGAKAATDALTEALELRGVERGRDRGTSDGGRLWTVMVRCEGGGVAVSVVLEQGIGADPARVKATVAALWLGVCLGMSYPARVPA